MIPLFDVRLIQSEYLVVALIVFCTLYVLLNILSKSAKGDRARAGTAIIPVITGASVVFLGISDRAAGLILASLLCLIVGRFDERLSLSAHVQMIWQLVIVFALIVSGWSIPYVTNVFGEGVIQLDVLSFGHIQIPGSLITALWVLLVMNAVNWFDGIDGLAGTLLAIAFGALVLVSLLPHIYNSSMFVLALIGLAAVLAFLIWNFPPGKVLMGTTGSWFFGMYLALVAIEGGGKIMTSLVILTIPIFDALFVAVRRIMHGKVPWAGRDRLHLHDTLLERGFSPTMIDVLAGTFTAALLIPALLFSPLHKLALLLLVAICWTAVIVLFSPTSYVKK